MKNDDNDTSIILNFDANMDDLKYYVGKSNMGVFEVLTWGVYSFSLITMDLHVALPICQTL